MKHGKHGHVFFVALSEVAIFCIFFSQLFFELKKVLRRVTRRGRKKPKGKFDKTRDCQSHHCGNLSGPPLAFSRDSEAEVVGGVDW